jgi:hypothetical protein
MLNANITDGATIRTRTNVTLGGGKAVHAGTALTVKGVKYAASPDCGGNRATERYRETAMSVTCRRCLKATAARAAELAAAEAEAYTEQADRDERARQAAKARELTAHVARRSGRTDIKPLRQATPAEARKAVQDFGKTRAAAALRALVGQVVDTVAEVTAPVARQCVCDCTWQCERPADEPCTCPCRCGAQSVTAAQDEAERAQDDQDAITVTVDLVTPTKGLVLAGEYAGTVLHTAKREQRPGAGWEAENAYGERVASRMSCVEAAVTAWAMATGLTGRLAITVVHEYQQTGQRDD